MNYQKQRVINNNKNMNRFDDTQLYPLIIQGDFRKIENFLKKYGIDSVDRDGRSFLTNTIEEGKNEFAKKIIDLGADINQQDNNGSTPLFAAIRAHNTEMINCLLNNPQINFNVTDKAGKNALRIALQFHPRDKELLLYLLRKGVDPFSADNKGITPYSLMLRYQSGEITKGGEKLDFSLVLNEIELHRN